jgi:hypothetical protein
MVRRTLQIPPTSSPGVTAAPTEIFGLLAPEAEALSWMIWGDLWLTAKPDSRLDVLAFEKQVREAPSGVPVAWRDLLSLVEDLAQIIDGTFIGSGNTSMLPPASAAGLADVHRTHELVVTADDSSFWWISAEDSIIQRFLQAFPQSIERDGYK